VVETRIGKQSATMVVDEFEIELQDHGKVTEMCRRFGRRLRDLPCHVGFVCLSKRDIDKNTGEVVYRPDLTPKFASDMLGYVDVAVYTTQEDGNPDDRSCYVGITRPVSVYRGKDRYGATPPRMANPTFDRIIEYVNSDDDFEDPYQAAYRSRLKANSDPAATVEQIEELELGVTVNT
jgi:hypothetical protein